MTTGFFPDDFNEWTKTVGKGAVIAEASIAKQMEVNADKRLFGFDALFRGLNPKDGNKGDPTSGLINWQNLKNLAQTKDYKNATTNIAKAELILDTIFLYDKEVIFSDKRGDSSNWFYAQNFQSDIPDKTIKEAYTWDTNGFYAQVAAILWAFKQYKPDIPVFPVFDSYLLKSAGTFDINSIQKNLDLLGLGKIISEIADPAPKNPSKEGYNNGNNWNIISTLYNSSLIDGFIGDSFKVGTEGTVPSAQSGLPDGGLPFYLDKSNPIPYALDSNYYELSTFKENALRLLPINSNYFGNIYEYGETYAKGDIPLTASIYVPTGVKVKEQLIPVSLPDNFDSTKYITSQKTPLGQGVQAPVNSNPQGSIYSISNGDYIADSIVNDGTLLNSEDLYNYGSITNNGVFKNNGTVFSRSGKIVNNGLISGNGSLNGDIINGGDISPGNSAGGFLVNGFLTHSEGSTKFIELAGDSDANRDPLNTGYDFLDVTGDLILDGGKLDVKSIEGFALTADQAFVIVKVGGDIEGEYEGLKNGELVGQFNAAGGGMIDLFISYDYDEGEITLFTE